MLLQGTRLFFPANNTRSLTAIGGSTGFLIQSPTSIPEFFFFEFSSVILKLLQSKLSFFTIYRPIFLPVSLTLLSVFLVEFNSILSIDATATHKFIIAGDFLTS